MEQNKITDRETSNLEEMFRQTLSEEEITDVDRAGKNLGRLNRVGFFLPFAGSVVSGLVVISALASSYLGGYIDETGQFTKEAPEYLTDLVYYGMIPMIGGVLASALLSPFNIPNYRKTKENLRRYDEFVRDHSVSE